MDNITQEQIDALIEFIDNTEEPASVTNVRVATILAFLNLKATQIQDFVQTAILSINEALAGKADTMSIGNARWLEVTQWPFCSLYSVEPKTDTQVPNNKMYIDSNGVLKYKDQYGEVTTLGNARHGMLYYCGDDIYRWNGSGFSKMSSGISAEDIIDFLTSTSVNKALSANMGRELNSRIGSRYTKTQTNVNALATKVDSLIDIIGQLANLAFKNSRPNTPSKIGSFDWGVNDGGSSSSPVLTSPAAGTTINVGTIAAGGSQVQYGLTIKGENFTGNTALSVSGTGFTINEQTLSASEVNSGTTVFITYTNNGSAAAQASGTLTISGGGITRTVDLYAVKTADGGGTPTLFNVSQTLSHCQSSYSGATIQDGTSFEIVITPDSGYTFSGGSFSASMANGDLMISNNQDGSRTVWGVASGHITINATAVPESVQPGEGVNVTKSGCRNCEIISDNTNNGVLASGTAYEGTVQINDVTSNAGSGHEPYVIPDNGITVKVGGNMISGYTFNTSTNKLTIPASLIVDDITIEVTAESPVIADRTIGSSGQQMTSDLYVATHVCYNVVYIEIPAGTTHLRWKHNFAKFRTKYSLTGGLAVRLSERSSNNANIQLVAAGASDNETIVALSQVPSSESRCFLSAAFCLYERNTYEDCEGIDECYVKVYNAQTGNDGITLFDGHFAEIHQAPQS